MDLMVLSQDLIDFKNYLIQNERAENTIKKYLSDVSGFLSYLDSSFDSMHINFDRLQAWKQYLRDSGLTPGSINTKICSINAFLNFKLRPDLKLKLLRVQKRVFRDKSRELTLNDYKRLVSAAYVNHKTRLGLILELLCNTGMRVSEIQYVTVESLKFGRIRINLKGKCREIFLGKSICKKLLDYAWGCHIKSGPVFLTRTGHVISRKQVWSELKALARDAGVLLSKVFPHNIRHLFARLYYKISGCDIAKLSDVLGHSCVDTTRIYLVSTGRECFNLLNKLDRTLSL